MKRLALAALVAAFLCLSTPAFAFNGDPGGGGPRCYWTWDGRYVCV